MLGSLIGGGLSGLGQGMQQNAQRDELQRQRLELQEQRQADRMELLAARSSARGAGEVAPSSLASLAKDGEMSPEQYDQAIIGANRRMGMDEVGHAHVDYRRAQRAGATTKTDPYNPELADNRDAGTEDTSKGYAYTLPKYEPGKVAPIVEQSARNMRAAFFGDKLEKVEQGRAESVVADMLQGAKSDTDIRRAGALKMAAEGKDRFGVSGNTHYDKAGIEEPQTTEFGERKLDNDADAIEQKRVAAANKLLGTGGAPGKAMTVQKVITDANGEAVAVFKDGSTKSLGVSSMDFEKRIDKLATEAGKQPANFGKDPKDVRQAVRNALGNGTGGAAGEAVRREILEKELERAKKAGNAEDVDALSREIDRLPKSASSVGNGASGASGAVAQPRSKAEYDALPRGARYMKNGKTFVKG